MLCPKCGSGQIRRDNFRWVARDDDGKAHGSSTLQLTIQCLSCNFGGVYPEFCDAGELGKWR